MKKVELLVNPNTPMLLKCTGQSYDGVDDNYCTFMSNKINFNRPLNIDYQRAKQTISFNPGDPLYHICWLSYFVRNMLENKQIDREGLDVALRYTVKWLHAQCDKLLRSATSDNDLSEFQLSQKVFAKEPRKDDCLFTFAIENLSSILTGLVVLMPENRYLAAFSSSMCLLSKCLEGALIHDPILSTKKHKDSFKTCVNVAKVDALFSKTFFLLANKQYVNAEAYANKCLKNINKIYSHDKQVISLWVEIALSFIAARNDDIDICLHHIDNVLKLLNNKKLKKYNVADQYFFESCVFAGEYFEKNGEIDKAIKYYTIAQQYSSNILTTFKHAKKLKSLTPCLVLQIEKQTMIDFSDILFNVKSYPEKSLFILYFKSTEHAEKFRKLMSKNTIRYSNISNPKTPEESNAVGFTIDNEFPVEVFFKALFIAKKPSKKVVIPVQSEPKVIVKEKVAASHVMEGESARHPHAAVTKNKPRKPKPENIPVIVVQPWEFLKSRKTKPLEIVEFPNTKKYFDPAQANGVATLCVNGFSGRWFACLCPQLIDALDALYPGEGAKLNKLFLSSIQLANDLCVPCYKEMKIKSKDLGIDLPYVFKIRLLGKGGLGNVRIYSKIIDKTADGKKLVIFSAINPDSHSKHTRPTDYGQTEVAHEQQSKEEAKLC